MNTRFVAWTILSLFIIVSFPAAIRPSGSSLVVHEWGTFTSIAGPGGAVIEWEPYRGLRDLPRFVHGSKIKAQGTVRMETPVIYFYSQADLVCNVRVRFPKGRITEIYPVPETLGWPLDAVEWDQVEVLPNLSPNFPIENAPSHYYHARETDAAPLRVWTRNSEQHEKFLFYRGVGSFDLPISARFANNQVIVRRPSRQALGEVLLFENRMGKIAYRFETLNSPETVLGRDLPQGDLQLVKSELEMRLVSHGLYLREAQAMVKTWEESWFEEGFRLFYVLPPAITEAVLPLSISPLPCEMVRVLVGRLEMFTPEAEEETLQLLTELRACSGAKRAEILKALRRPGRFSECRIRQALQRVGDQDERRALEFLLTSINTF